MPLLLLLLRSKIMNISNILNEKHIVQPDKNKPRCTEAGHFYWLKGETIKMTWDIDGDVKNEADNTFVNAKKFMEDKSVEVSMYDYMGRKIKEWKLERPGTTISILIENDEKKGDFFARDLLSGTYQICIIVYSHIGMVLELVKRSDCIIEVR